MARTLSLIMLVLAIAFFWWVAMRGPSTEGGRAMVTCPDGAQISFAFRSWATLEAQAEDICTTHIPSTPPTSGAV